MDAPRTIVPGAFCLESDEIPAYADTDIGKSLDLAVGESHAVAGLNADAPRRVYHLFQMLN